MRRFSILLLLCLCALGCEKQRSSIPTKDTVLQMGDWLVQLEVQDGELLPFNLTVAANNVIKIYNAEEVIVVDEIVITGDSVRIQTPVFEGYLSGKIAADGKLVTGDFIKSSLNRIVPFTMRHGVKARFPDHQQTAIANVNGNWETVFSPDSETDRYIAKGIFEQKGDVVTGTFRTTTGDYRYLEGRVSGDELRLSTFDGAHAFLFTARVKGDSLQGTFYSGNHFKETFRAKRNPNYELPDATALTYLKEGYDKLAFSFPDDQGNMVSLQDDRFKNKVVLVQVMGTWCPNCLDETKYYLDYLERHPNSDLEIVALAFEYAPTRENAFASIGRLKERLGVAYPILLAQYGSSDKQLAQEKMPMLNHVLSYPTTIFIDRKGEVRRIHTGFNGPATGDKHLAFKVDFEAYVDGLLAE